MFIKSILITAIFISCSTVVFAQLPKGSYAIGVNPFGFGEPSIAIGVSGYHQFSNKISIMAEPSFLIGNIHSFPNTWKQIKGFRIVVQPKVSVSFDNKFYMGLDGRFKTYSFKSTGSFIKNDLSDTITVNNFFQRQTLFGGALMFGLYVNLNKKSTVFLDMSMGIGVKHRLIKRVSNIAGYDKFYLQRQSDVALYPQYEYNNAGTVYAPGGIRLIFLLPNKKTGH